MERMGQVIGLKPEVIAEYNFIHATVWPSVLKAIAQSNIRNQSIFGESLKICALVGNIMAPIFPPIWKKWKGARNAKLVEISRSDAGTITNPQTL